MVIWAPESATAFFTLNSTGPRGVWKERTTSIRGSDGALYPRAFLDVLAAEILAEGEFVSRAGRSSGPSLSLLSLLSLLSPGSLVGVEERAHRWLTGPLM